MFDFFNNCIAHRATTIIDRFRCNETFHSFLKVISSFIYKGALGWNETLTVSPLTTPEITTPPSELNYWRSVSLLLNCSYLNFDYKLIL